MPVATAVTLDSPRPKQLSDGNPQGTVLGTATTDTIGFYNVPTPVSQALGQAQAAIVRGQQSGFVATYATSQSPGSSGVTTTVESSLTVIGSTAAVQIVSTDLLFINKPTAQAGLGMGNVRVSAANVAGVQFSNLTAVSLTPTAGQKYGIIAVRGFPTITQTITPAAVSSQTIAEQQFTVTGVRAGELLQVMKPTAQAGLDIYGCRVVGNNLVGITYANVSSTATPITPTAESYTFFSLGGLDALNNEVLIEANIGTVAGGVGTATVTTQEVSITVTGLATTDTVKGVSKPTWQAGLGIVGSRVSAANVLGVTYVELTGATITPTASEVYGVSIHRPNPAAPLVMYNPTLTPTACASQTTNEQTFTITGLVTGSAVWVNKPSATPGIGIAGVRISGSNTLAINFANTTTGSITPPAEAYLVGNFQQAIPDAGNSFVFSAVPQAQQASTLGNAIRSAMVAMGLIAGA